MTPPPEATMSGERQWIARTDSLPEMAPPLAVRVVERRRGKVMVFRYFWDRSPGDDEFTTVFTLRRAPVEDGDDGRS
jgi:hypothetical protein